MRPESCVAVCCIALALMLPACSPRPAAPDTPRPGSAQPPLPGSAQPASSAAPAPAPPQVPSASIAAIEVARDSATDKRVKVVFINPTARLCAITRYVLSWPGGSKPAQPDSFRIPAGESRERWLIVHPNDGDLSSLAQDAAKVTIETDCSSP